MYSIYTHSVRDLDSVVKKNFCEEIFAQMGKGCYHAQALYRPWMRKGQKIKAACGTTWKLTLRKNPHVEGERK